MKRLSMRKIREALRLSFEGLSTREMALSLAIGRTTLREYLGRARDAGLIWNWPLPDALSDADLEHVLQPVCELYTRWEGKLSHGVLRTACPLNRSLSRIGPMCTPSYGAKG